MTKEEILCELKEIAEKDEDYMLDIDGWYYRINKSTGTIGELSKLFGIPAYLVQNIKELEKKNERTI